VSRRVAFGANAIEKIASVCKDVGISKILIFSGAKETKKITQKLIIPQLEEQIEFSHIPLSRDVSLEELARFADLSKDNKTHFMAVGGGKVIDYVKVIASLAHRDYVAVPTNVSHDGFSSPYINFLLRERIRKSSEKSKFPAYKPISPLAIIGDTKLVSQAPAESWTAGIGDVLSKWVAVKDWKLAHYLKGEKFDIYASTFSEMTANLISDRVMSLRKRFFSETGFRDLLKALGSSGVAMCIAGSSRPASGSEHLVSHALDKLSKKYDLKEIPHGHKTGLNSIFMTYLHGGDWEKIRNVLKIVGGPTTLEELGIDREIMIDAVQTAQTIRPERYTILSELITKEAIVNALEMTGID